MELVDGGFVYGEWILGSGCFEVCCFEDDYGDGEFVLGFDFLGDLVRYFFEGLFFSGCEEDVSALDVGGDIGVAQICH